MAGASAATTATDNSDAQSGLSPQLRYAIKTALSLTLAYLLPMAMGWPQPQTAATTVMLIAATGMVSESLQKGVLRVMGTVIGAVIGLSLIALFPQDRMVYLAAVSLVVAFFIYLYGAYQGDSTVFMLSAVVTLMVFNGGDAEGAFIYGVDRAFMTVFGVLVYTLVASTLWPIKITDNTRSLAREAGQSLHTAFRSLTGDDSRGDAEDALNRILASQEAFQNHFTAVRQDAEGVKRYLAEWRAVANCLADLEGTLLPVLRNEHSDTVEYRRFIANYDEYVESIETLFTAVRQGWEGHAFSLAPEELAISFHDERLAGQSHRDIALIATHADSLAQIQTILRRLLTALNSIVFDQPGFKSEAVTRYKPAFHWFDRESLFTGIRALVTFWFATAIWILYNPPGGFMFVTLCTVLIPLVSYTPVTPKLLVILFSVGFIFAVPAYVFLLPGLTHWLELALFIFAYAFFGFFLFKGPVSIFFLMGLFTLGIQNTMSYNFAVIMSIVLMFYMVCAALIVSVNFPFTSNTARLFAGIRQRFFDNSAALLVHPGDSSRLRRRIKEIRLNIGDALVTKMRTWGPMIDNDYYPGNSAESISAFIAACDSLQGQLRVQQQRVAMARDNRLIRRAINSTNGSLQAGLCRALASEKGSQSGDVFDYARQEASAAKQRLDNFLGESDIKQYSDRELADFYVFLSLYGTIYQSLEKCRETAAALDWTQLRKHQF